MKLERLIIELYKRNEITWNTGGAIQQACELVYDLSRNPAYQEMITRHMGTVFLAELQQLVTRKS